MQKCHIRDCYNHQTKKQKKARAKARAKVRAKALAKAPTFVYGKSGRILETIIALGIVRISIDGGKGKELIELNFNTNGFICHTKTCIYHGTFTYKIVEHGSTEPIQQYMTFNYLNTVDKSLVLTPLDEPFQFTSTFVMTDVNMEKNVLCNNRVVLINRNGFMLTFNEHVIPDSNTNELYIFWSGM